jgi:hypothetical protein
MNTHSEPTAPAGVNLWAMKNTKLPDSTVHRVSAKLDPDTVKSKHGFLDESKLGG